MLPRLRFLLLVCYSTLFFYLSPLHAADQPIFTAVKNADISSVERLLAENKDIVVNSGKLEEATSLHWAVSAPDHQEERAKIVSLLLINGADVNEKTDTGLTALHYAAANDLYKAVGVLLDHHADLNVTDNSGNTPLHYAAQYDHQWIVERLLAAGANPNVKNNKKEGLIEVSGLRGSIELTALLQKWIIFYNNRQAILPINNWKIIYSENYGEARDYPGLPVVDDITPVLRSVGWNIVPEHEKADGEIRIHVEGIPYANEYTVLGTQEKVRLYLRAEVKISVELYAAGRQVYNFLYGSVESTGEFPPIVNFSFGGAPSRPEDAPFFSAYTKEKDRFIDQFINLFFNTYGFDIYQIATTERMKELFLEHKDVSQDSVFSALQKNMDSHLRDRFELETLIALVANTAIKYRVKIIHGLVSIKDDIRISDTLIALLKDTDENVRKASIEALGYFRETRAVDPIISLFANNNRTDLIAAAQALSIINDNRAVGPLMSILKHQDKYVRKAAAQALGKIADDSAIESLRFCLNDNEQIVRDAATTAIINIEAR